MAEEADSTEVSPDEAMGLVVETLGLFSMSEGDSTPPAKSEESVVEPEEDAEESEESDGEALESDEDAEEDDAEEDDSDEEAGKDEHEALPPEVQKALDKRIGKEVRKRKELEEQMALRDSRIADLEAELDAAKSGGSVPVPADVHPLMLVDSEADVQAFVKKTDEMLDWLEDHRDEGYEPEEGEGYTPAQIRKRIREIERERASVVPAAKDRLTTLSKAREDARSAYPELAKADSELSLELRKLVREQPALKLLPDWPLRLADMLNGAKLRQKPNKEKSPKVKVRAPAIPTSPPPGRKVTPAPRQSNEVDLINQVASMVRT